MSTQVAFFGITHAYASRVKATRHAPTPTVVIHTQAGEFAQGGYLDLHLATEEEAKILLDAVTAALYLIQTGDQPT